MKDQNDYKLLVIEDDLDDFLRIKLYLEEQIQAPQFTHLLNFQDAKALLMGDNIDFDAIFLDIGLPDNNGEQLVRELCAICHSCAVIVLTGYADFQFSRKTFSLGAADYLLKNEINASSLYRSLVYNIERMKMNIRLMESEKRYINLFELSPQPMWVYDPASLAIVQVNDAAMKLYGYTKEEFLAMTVTGIQDPVATAGEKLAGREISKMPGALSGRQRHRKKSGDWMEVELYSSPVQVEEKTYQSVIAIDVTEKVLFEYELTKTIIKTQEDERYEIGRELHDNVCQILATSKLSLNMIEHDLPARSRKWYKQCREYIIMASDEIRNLSHRLAPVFFTDSTLESSFKALLETYNADHRYKISLHFNNAAKHYVLNREMHVNLFRILQEQLGNIHKHANATMIEINVNIDNNQFVMLISDNGAGFNVQQVKSGIGIANMMRRTELLSGKLDIVSSPGNGCELWVRIKLPEQPK